MTPEDVYQQVLADLADRGARPAKMFGMPSVKDPNGKAFAGLRRGELVCRLGRDTPEFAAAMGLAGAHLFDPSGEGKPMKDWVCIPAEHAARWTEFADAALSVPR
jgi:hypothetical protein